MRTGTISETVLKRSVLKNICYRSDCLVSGPAVGQKCGARAVAGGKQMVFSEVSVTGCAGIAEEIAFERLRNDVSASGGQLAGILITLFFPAAGEERELKSIMNKLAAMARTHEVDILGGHTEVLDAVTEPIIALTGAGFAAADTNRKSGNFEPGQDIVMTKWAGAAGAAGLVRARRHNAAGDCLDQRFSNDFLDRSGSYFHKMSSVPDVDTAVAFGVTALYNAGKKGVFGALWELGEASGVGIQVELKKIPVRQETIEVCEFIDCNPYLIASDGVLLAGTHEGARLVEAYRLAGIPAAVIGTVTGGNDRVVINGAEKRFLVPPGTDV